MADVDADHVVVGAGLTGCLLAARLADRGGSVILLDRRPDLRVTGTDSGRSINLAISTRGLDALSHVGLDGWVRETGLPMAARMVHDRQGVVSTQPYGSQSDHVLYSVDRDGLNGALLDAAETRHAVDLRLDEGAQRVVLGAPPMVEMEGGAVVRARTVYGADGAFSRVRGRLVRSRGMDFAQEFSGHGYKELTIPADAEGRHQLDPGGLHIWPRRHHMLIALPNGDGSFTGTLFWPLDGPDRLAGLHDDDAVVALFERDFGDAASLMPGLLDEFWTHPVGSMVTIRCSPWHRGDQVLLLGDAAHAVLPFYGQGANAALEDVTILCELLDRHATTEEAFEALSRHRPRQTNALAELARQNHVEMRDHVASRWFRVRAAARRFVARFAPRSFPPLYTRVTFSRQPYDEARADAHRQDRMLARVAAVVALLIVGLAVLAVLAVLAIAD